jgi:hypothetical protein
MKCKMSVVFATLVFALPLSAAFGQTDDAITVSAELVDKSGPNAPFTSTGTVKCSEWVEGEELRAKGEGTVIVTNTSHRQIVAWAAKTIVHCLHAGSNNILTVNDHFFRDHNLPEEHWEIPAGFNEGTNTSENGKRKDPHDILLSTVRDPVFTSELTFVQFDDGSIWGSKDVFAQVEADRVVVRKFLEHLSTESVDEPTFLRTLAEDQPPNTLAENVSSQLRRIQKESGVGAAIDKVRDALQAAERRKASGRF